MSSEEEPIEPEGIPPVVAVVVTCDSGPWLEETLEALGQQDYPDFSVLVLDAGSEEDPTPRIAGVLPTAFVRRLGENRGFGPSANEVLDLVEGASHYLVCHDDVAPEPDAVRVLVEEAFRSNAGIVAPKLVAWDDPTRLLAVGVHVDKAGVPEEQVGRGEPDQEQYDAVRDVFVAPGGCTLIRADLFTSLGGFDPEIQMFGDDLDLCWRAQVVGARVIVAPDARVRHLEAASAGRRAVLGAAADPDRGIALVDIVRPLQLRNRLRTVMKCYGRFHLVRVLPQLLVLAIGETLFAVSARRRPVAAATVAAWRWNWSWTRLGQLRAARRELQSQRALPDREIRRLQVRGSARMSAFLRGQLTATHPGEVITTASRDFAESVRRGERRLHLTVWSLLVVVLVAGSRHLLTRPLPVVGDFVPFPDGALDMLRLFVSGWRTAGLGSESPAPVAFAILGAAGTVLLGAMGAVQKVLLLGCLPLGLVGVHRLARPLASDRAPLVAVVAYAAIPLPYNALATGRLQTLIAYAFAPWLLARMARAAGRAPFDGLREHGDGRPARHALPLALLLAVVVALAPAALGTVGVLVAGMLVGSLLAGGARGALKAAAVTVLAVVGAAVLLFPWSLELVLPGAEVAGFAGLGIPTSDAPALSDLLRFKTGPMGAAPFGWAVLVAAAVPLVLARAERLQWSMRLWTIALVGWVSAWALVRGWLPLTGGHPDALLVAPAVALSLAAATGVTAFERELHAYRFGWRQLAAVGGAVALGLATLPLVGEAVSGRWDAPRRSHASVLSWLPEQQRDGGFRTLWLGDPRVLPAGGWRIREGLGYATSRNGFPEASDLWPGAAGTTGLIADAIEIAEADGTTSLGRLLAPMAVRYIVVPSAAAPEGGPRYPPPAGVLESLADQIDLRRLDTVAALTVYENTAWIPTHAALAPETAAAAGQPIANTPSAALAGAPVLRRHDGPLSWSGEVPDDAVIHVAETASPRWRMQVDGSDVDRSKSFGFANAYAVASGGDAVLSYRTGPVRYAALLLQVVLWAAGIASVWRWRRGEREEVE